MQLKATISGTRLSDLAGRPPVEDWKKAGNGLRLRIINRTRGQNVDANGKLFVAYSEGYAKAKAKKSGKWGEVDLTGVKAGRRMLDNITFQVNPTGNPALVLYFASPDKQQIALYHMGEGRVDREFFGLSPEDMDYAVEILRRAWMKRVGGSRTPGTSPRV